MVFDALETLADDPVGQLYVALAMDPNPNKIDLGIGVYRDEAGRSPIMASVREAQSRLLQKQTTKEYLPPFGNRRYSKLMERFMLGADHPLIDSDRIHTVQTPGAGGGLRSAAQLIKTARPDATVWLSSPTWSHQHLVIRSAGLKVAEYPYYDTASNRLLFDEMIAGLRKCAPGDVVLLHACCHNPTGEDLSSAQWRVLADTLIEARVMPFIDLVYQGFGDGIEEDVLGTRLMAAAVPEMILVGSSSKTFGIYRDRAGTISVICKNAEDATNAGRHMSIVTRSLYFMPPDAGCSIVVEILEDQALQAAWRAELDAMRARVIELRKTFSGVLNRETHSRDFDYIARQKGMFSLLPLSQDDLAELRLDHGIYLMPDSRINLAALTKERAERVGTVLAQVMMRRHNHRNVDRSHAQSHAASALSAAS